MVPGTTCYRYPGVATVNLSHYSSTCIDPSNPDLLWTYQAYANSTGDRQWCTAWAACSLSSVTKPISGTASATEVAPQEKDGQAKAPPR